MLPSGRCPFTGEIEHVKRADPTRLKRTRIRRRVAAVEQQHRKTLAAGEEIPVEGAEREKTRPMRHDLLGLGDLQDLDVAVLELHDAIMRAPGVTITPAHHEPGADIDVRRRVQVADRMHDMVEALGHRRPFLVRYFTDENEVGTSN